MAIMGPRELRPILIELCELLGLDPGVTAGLTLDFTGGDCARVIARQYAAPRDTERFGDIIRTLAGAATVEVVEIPAPIMRRLHDAEARAERAEARAEWAEEQARDLADSLSDLQRGDGDA